MLAYLRGDLRPLIENYGWMIADKVARLFVGLLVATQVARFLGPTQYGELAYLASYLAVFQCICGLGLDGIVVRRLAVEDRNTLLLGVVVARIVAGALSLLIAIAVSAFDVSTAPRTALVVVAGVSLLFQHAETIDLWFQARNLSRISARARFAAYALCAFVRLMLIQANAPLWAFAAVLTLESALSALALLHVYLRSKGRDQTLVMGNVPPLLREGFPYLVTALSAVVYMRIDQFFIQHLLEPKALGIYASAAFISSLLHFIPTTLAVTAAPIVASLKAKSESEYIRIIEFGFRVSTIFGLSTGLLMLPAAGAMMALLFGSEYMVGADVLRIHVFTNLFIAFGMTQSLWLVNEGKGRLSVYRTMLGAVVSMLLLPFAIRNFGLEGAASVAVIAQACSTVLSNAFFAPAVFRMQLSAVVCPFRRLQ